MPRENASGKASSWGAPCRVWPGAVHCPRGPSCLSATLPHPNKMAHKCCVQFDDVRAPRLRRPYAVVWARNAQPLALALQKGPDLGPAPPLSSSIASSTPGNTAREDPAPKAKLPSGTRQRRADICTAIQGTGRRKLNCPRARGTRKAGGRAAWTAFKEWPVLRNSVFRTGGWPARSKTVSF